MVVLADIDYSQKLQSISPDSSHKGPLTSSINHQVSAISDTSLVYIGLSNTIRTERQPSSIMIRFNTYLSLIIK